MGARGSLPHRAVPLDSRALPDADILVRATWLACLHGRSQRSHANSRGGGPRRCAGGAMTAPVRRIALPTMPAPFAGFLAELERRQPQLAAASRLFLLGAIPCVFAMMVDPRTVNDVS